MHEATRALMTLAMRHWERLPLIYTMAALRENAMYMRHLQRSADIIARKTKRMLQLEVGRTFEHRASDPRTLAEDDSQSLAP